MDLSPATCYRRLLDLTNAMVNQTSREALFKALTLELSRFLAFDRFSINLFDDKTESLSYFSTAEGISPSEIDRGKSRPLAKGAIARAVIRSRKPLILKDLNQVSYWVSAKAMLDAGLTASMAFPLMVRDKVLGAMHISFKQPPEQMDDLADFLMEVSSQVAVAVDNMLAHSELMAVNQSLEEQKRFLLRQSESGGYEPGRFIYASKVMADVIAQAERVAASDASVLITGETGTGKDYMAHYIHNLSSRRDSLFVKVNCPALAESLFESELFGHAKGAFTGAHSKRLGRLEMAHGGTIFLDEIGDLPPPQQAKLLNVLQDKVFERVGESRPIRADFRVIAATNQDIQGMIRTKRFRQDLFYRLNTVSLNLPPLRERIEEVPLLIERLAEAQAGDVRRPVPRFTPKAMEMLRRYSWPGNVRELKNLVKRLIILHSGEDIGEGHLRSLLQTRAQDKGRPLTLAEMERRHIQEVLDLTRGKLSGKGGAAELLGLPRTTLQYRMKKYGLMFNKNIIKSI